MAALNFSTFFSLKRGKWGPSKGNGDLLGTQKLKKVPTGTRVPRAVQLTFHYSAVERAERMLQNKK